MQERHELNKISFVSGRDIIDCAAAWHGFKNMFVNLCVVQRTCFGWKKWKFTRLRIPLSLLLTSGNGTPVFGLVTLLRKQYCLVCGTGGGLPCRNTTTVEIHA